MVQEGREANELLFIQERIIMSKDVKVALIGAAATIIAAIIGGIFLLRSVSGSSTTDNKNATATSITTTQTTGIPPSGQTPPVDVNGAVSTIDTFCEEISAGAMQFAYNLTSQNYRNQHTVDNFSNQFSNVDISNGSGCLAGNATVSGSSVAIPLTIHYRIGFQTSTSHYTATLIQDSQGHSWMIDSIA
jgi:hypothetical protein